jgi:hypothetical protein
MNRYFSNVIAGMLILSILSMALIESATGVSLRTILSLLFFYYIAINFNICKISVPLGIWKYLGFLLLYTVLFFIFGSGNNLIIHLLTICFGVVVVYMLLLNKQCNIEQLWHYAIRFWLFIYFTLVVELVLVAMGYQIMLYDIFPEANRAYGLPAYRSIFNTFANHFNLKFDGLNSISLQVQAYGQLCVMLTIFGFSYSQKMMQKNHVFKIIFYVLIPLIFYSISPNITAVIILVFILSYLIFFKYYTNQISSAKAFFPIFIVSIMILIYYLSDLGFVRSYSSDELYDLFLGRQIEYVLSESLSDYLLGVGLNEYYAAASDFEIAYLSYLSVSGLIFGMVNLFLLLKIVFLSFGQMKALKVSDMHDSRIEIQAANLLIALSMLFSSIHFPVITSYLGTGIFVFHFAFAIYIYKMNKFLSKTEKG